MGCDVQAKPCAPPIPSRTALVACLLCAYMCGQNKRRMPPSRVRWLARRSCLFACANASAEAATWSIGARTASSFRPERAAAFPRGRLCTQPAREATKTLSEVPAARGSFAEGSFFQSEGLSLS